MAADQMPQDQGPLGCMQPRQATYWACSLQVKLPPNFSRRLDVSVERTPDTPEEAEGIIGRTMANLLTGAPLVRMAFVLLCPAECKWSFGIHPLAVGQLDRAAGLIEDDKFPRLTMQYAFQDESSKSSADQNTSKSFMSKFLCRG